MNKILFPRLSNKEKLDIVLHRYKERGINKVRASDIGKRLDMMSNKVASLLKQSDLVEYDKKSCIWVIL